MKQNKTAKKRSRTFSSRLLAYSNPRTAQSKAYQYLGRTAKLYPATNANKKYSVFDKKNNRWVNFGQMGYEDFTKHHDKARRKNYLTRSRNIKGDWKANRYSPNNLAQHILW
jgi:hypothetical protein